MDQERYKRLIGEHPMLKEDGIVPHKVRVVESDRRYLEFCRKLSVSPPPMLLVYDNDIARAAVSTVIDDRCAVFIREDHYEAFLRKEPHAELIVAHELGHIAADYDANYQLINRRSFLQKHGSTAAATLIGAAFVGHKAANHEATAVAELTPAENKKIDHVAYGLYGVAGVAIAVLLRQLMQGFSERQYQHEHEYRADAEAASVMPTRDVIVGMSQWLEIELREVGKGQKLDRLREKFARDMAKKPALSADKETRDLTWALMLANEFKSPMHSAYSTHPTFAERIDAIHRLPDKDVVR